MHACKANGSRTDAQGMLRTNREIVKYALSKERTGQARVDEHTGVRKWDARQHSALLHRMRWYEDSQEIGRQARGRNGELDWLLRLRERPAQERARGRGVKQ